MTVIATLHIYNPPKNLQGMTIYIGSTSSVGDTMPSFTINIEQTIRIGDTKYHIWCGTVFSDEIIKVDK